MSAAQSMRAAGAAALICLLSACGGGEGEGVYVGYVEAEYVYIAAPQSGWLTQAAVREGDSVEAGDIVFELDKQQQRALYEAAAGLTAQAAAQAEDIETGARPAEIAALEAQLEEARAQEVRARADRDRALRLVREGFASDARGDQATADYLVAVARVKAAEEAIDVAKLAGRDAAREAADAAATAADASLAEAKWRLDQRTVKAQAGGRVEQVFHRKGEFVTAGAPVLSVLPPGALKVRFFVPQDALPSIAIGDRMNVLADGRPGPVGATVSFIAAEAEFTPPVIYSAESREKLVFLVEARLDESAALRPGLPVDIVTP